jgi:hypothetical protein
MDMILRSVTQNLVAYSNAFLVKVRDFKRSSGMPIQRIAGPSLQPIAAYFPIDPTSIRVKRDFHGKVLKYWQRVPGNPIMPQFIPEDVVHVYYERKEGFAFGTPYIVPVLDDIRSLRRMEENVEMLVTQHIFPLFHYKVGTETAPAEIYDDGTTEVDIIKDQIEKMPTEGSIVTPERHEITTLGAQGKALDASNYLKYFEKRVLSGLGISEIALGRGDTANRSTAGSIDKSMTDRCKDFQDVIESFVNEYIFKELLYEGGFLIDETEDSFVKLKFREIDIDSMLKTQNHSVFKYEHHAITETELREEISRDPIGDEQRKNMYFEMVQKPNALIMARDEPYTPTAKKAITAGGGESKGPKSTENREKPTNQHGTKPAKTSQKKDYEFLTALLDHLWHLTKLDILDMVNDMLDWKNITVDNLGPAIKITREEINKRTLGMNINHKILEDGIGEIFKDLGDILCTNIKNTDMKGDLVYRVSGVFESLRFKLDTLSQKVLIEQEVVECQK